MRNISFFPVYVSVFLMIAAGNSHGLSITPRLGFLWGQGDEIVYNYEKKLPSGDDALISRLFWDLKPLFYIGVDIDHGPGITESKKPWSSNGIVLGLSLKFGLPLKTGIMEDFDWAEDGDFRLLLYSKHDAYSGLGTFACNLSAGYSWAFSPGLWLKTSGEISFLRYSWIARDGYIQYSYDGKPWHPGLPTESTPGDNIAYTQNWLVFAPALEFGYFFLDAFTVSIMASWTPLTYNHSRDDHFKRGPMVFLDYPHFGKSLRWELAFGYIAKQNLEFGMIVSKWSISGARGDTYQSENGGRYYYNGYIAGAGFKLWDFSITAKYTF